MNKCTLCGKDTKNDKFCSRSCAATWNNKYFIKRKKKQWKCVTCGDSTKDRRKYCDDCFHDAIGYGRNPTVKDMMYKNKNNLSSVYSAIRYRARVSVSKEPRECEFCGYSKHVEVAHIFPIADFPEDTLVSAVNARSNLKKLCPNCHWEFDNLPR